MLFFISDTTANLLADSIDSQVFNLGFGIKTKLEDSGFTQFVINVESGVISLSKPGGFLQITNASNEQMRIVRQGISQVKTPYNFSRIDSGTRKPDDLKMKVKFLKKETKSLSSSAIKIAFDLFKILPHIKKLPILLPIRDINLLNSGQYRKKMWEYLDHIRDDSEFKFFHGALKVETKQIENPTSGAPDVFIEKIITSSEFGILSGMKVSTELILSSPDVFTIPYLLTLEKQERLEKRKEIIKNLSAHIWYSINSQVKDRASQDVARRRLLRFHVTILQSIRKLEMYCALKPRKKHETIKSQAVRKIIKRSNNKLTGKSITLMIQRAHRIERLLDLAEGEWRFLDVYEELTPCFFTSTINSCYNFEIFLELVKSNTTISSDDAEKRYEDWKKSESIKKAEHFNDACEQAGINIRISSEDLE
jgi:hypothetical protein